MVKMNDQEDENSGWKDVNVECKDTDNKDELIGGLRGVSNNDDINDDTNSPSNSGELIERVSNAEAESLNTDDINDNSLPDDEKNNAVNNNERSQTVPPPSPPKQAQEVPQYVIEKFMSQLQRLEENHQEELQQIQRQHQLEMIEAQDNAANNDAWQSKLQSAEEHYHDEMAKHKETIEEHAEHTKKMDKRIFNLQREVEKYQVKSERL